MANTPNRPPGRSIKNLRMVWSFALRYPGHIAVAMLALLVAAGATSGVPYAFKLIIDKGFAAKPRGHQTHQFTAGDLDGLARRQGRGSIQVIDAAGGAVSLKQLVNCVSCTRFHLGKF